MQNIFSISFKWKPKLYKINTSIKILILFFFTILTSSIQIAFIQQSISTISTLSTYTFNIQRNSDALNIPQGSFIQILLPTAFINQIALKSGNQVDCSSIELNSASLICEYNVNILKIINGFPIQSNLKNFAISVNKITNPFPAREYKPFSIILYQNLQKILQSSEQPAKIATTSGKSKCSISSYINNMANKRGSIVISYQSQYISTSNSSYKQLITMSRSYPSDPLSSNISPLITGYTPITSSGKIFFNNVNYSTSINISLLMPPSTQGAYNFITIQSFIQNLGDIDQCIVNIDNVTANIIDINLTSTQYQVQKIVNYTFQILLTSTIFSTDSIVIQFPLFYDLNMVNQVIFSETINGVKSINKSSNVITIKDLTTTNIQNKRIVFTLPNIKNPFDVRPVNIKIKTITSNFYIRDQSITSISITNNIIIINNFTCSTYQIGYKTPCKLNFTLSSSLTPLSQIRIIFPSSLWMLSQSGSNTQCSILSLSSQLNSIFQCRFIQRMFILSKFNSTIINIIQPFTAMIIIERSSVDVDHRVQLPWTISKYNINIATYSADNYTIDTGIFTITTNKRQIFNKQNNSIQFSSSQTLTSTQILITYTLPYDKSISYIMLLYLPLQLISSTSYILPSYGNFISYDSTTFILLLKLTDITSVTNKFNISGFKTFKSTKPIQYYFQLLYDDVVYFYYTEIKTVENAKNIQQFSIKQNNNIVYQENILRFNISQLENQDIIVITTNEYNQYHVNNMQYCNNNSIITCNLDNTIIINNANNLDPNLKLTQFQYIIKNPPYVGTANFIINVYQSLKTYIKQTSTFTISVTSTYLLPLTSLILTSTNPYFNQSTTLSLSISLFTPNATIITIILPSTLTYLSDKCITNCYNNLFNNNTNQFIANVNGLNIKVEFNVKNGMNFNQLIQISSKDNLNRNKDYGSINMKTICQSPCRSCQQNNKTKCLSCYNFPNSNNTLSTINNQCISQCQSNQYQITQSNLLYCKPCPISCSICTNLTYCSSCYTNYNFYNNTCIQYCPTGYYSILNNNNKQKQCQKCYQTCTQCQIISTNCTKCISGYYLYLNQCRNTCPTGGYYILNGQCTQCKNNCIQCMNNTGICLTCSSNFYLYEGQCYSLCPVSGYSKNQTSGKCQPCPFPCSVCGQFINTCTKCSSKYYQFNNRCYTTCTQIQGYYNIEQTKQCGKCIQPCKTCLLKGDYCESCIKGLVLDKNQCKNQCPDGTYAKLSISNNITVCTSCVLPCLKCTSDKVCLLCKSPYILSGTTCVTKCLSTQFPNLNNQCQTCPLSCSKCNITGCLSCSSSTQFLYNQSCSASCSPLYKNQLSKICQQCQSPCQTCTLNSTLCQSCINSYSYLEQKQSCLKVCPPGYFSENYNCIQCDKRNQYCKDCTYSLSSMFICTQCKADGYKYGYVCVGECPFGSINNNNICISQNCTQISNCQSCSDLLCLSCISYYTLSSGRCQFKLISAVSQLPLPFPFLILIIFIIISSLLLKFYYPKMYTPLYLYSFCGLIQSLNIILFTLLSVWTSQVNINIQDSIINQYYLAVVICIMYIIGNVVSMMYDVWVLKNDKKYKQWYRKDNHKCSIIITILSVIISFRFYIIKFSKLGNKQYFSAKLQSKDKFTLLNILSLSSIILISTPCIILAAYLAYYQTQMNYLFFTCIQLSITSVIMIILCILILVIPDEYCLENKNQYKHGYEEGRSVQGLIDRVNQVIEEQEYYQGKTLGIREREDQNQNNIIKSKSQFNQQFISNIQTYTAFQTKALNQQNYQAEQQDNQIQTQIQIIKFNNTNKNNTKKIQQNLQQDKFDQITLMIQHTLRKKTQLLESLVKDQTKQLINQINQQLNQNYSQYDDIYNNNGKGKKSNQKTIQQKKIGYIARQLITKYQQIDQQSDDSSIGEQLIEYSDITFHQKQLNNKGKQSNIGKLVNINEIKKKQQQKQEIHPGQLKNHQGLSLKTQLQYLKNKQKKQNKQKAQHQIQKIKLLVEQLALKQLQQKALKDKLLKLKQKQLQLTNQEYKKLKNKMEKNRQQTQDKLNKISNIFGQKKERKQKRKQQKLSKKKVQQQIKQARQIQQQIKQARKIHSSFIVQARSLISQPKDMQIRPLSPQKLIIESSNAKQILIPSKRDQFYSSTTPKFKQQYKSRSGSIYSQRQRQRSNISRGSQFSQILPELKQHSQQQQLNMTNEKMKKKNQQNMLPLNSTQKYQNNFFRSKQIFKNNKKQQQQQKQQQQILINQQSQNHSHLSQQQQQPQPNLQKSKASQPLQFDSPLPSNQLSQIYLQQHPNIIFKNDWRMNNTQKVQDLNDEKRQKEQKGQDFIQNRQKKQKSKIEFHYGRVQTMENYDHWPIDPELQEKILQVQSRANKYLIDNKKVKKQSQLQHFVSQNIQSTNKKHNNQTLNIQQNKINKLTQIDSKNLIKQNQTNSIFDLERDSQLNLQLQKGQMLVFDDQEALDQNEQNDQRQLNEIVKKQSKRIVVKMDNKQKVSKRRVNRSIINLSPGKF